MLAVSDSPAPRTRASRCTRTRSVVVDVAADARKAIEAPLAPTASRTLHRHRARGEVRRFVRACTTRLMRGAARMRTKYDRARIDFRRSTRANCREFAEAQLIGINLYLYGRASPVVFTDPSGLQEKPASELFKLNVTYNEGGAGPGAHQSTAGAEGAGSSGDATPRSSANLFERGFVQGQLGVSYDDVAKLASDPLGIPNLIAGAMAAPALGFAGLVSSVAGVAGDVKTATSDDVSAEVKKEATGKALGGLLNIGGFIYGLGKVGKGGLGKLFSVGDDIARDAVTHAFAAETPTDFVRPDVPSIYENPPAQLAGLQATLEKLAEVHLLPQYLKKDPGLEAGYTGSFATGYVGNPNKETFAQPIDLARFDIDYWIKSDVLHAEKGGRLHANREFREALGKTPGFEGLKPGKEGFSIKFRPRR